MSHHEIPIRIYYEDTDAGGVVYHGSYLNFAERGRTEFLRHIGHTNSEIRETHNLIFVVRHMEIDYIKPGFLDDMMALRTSVEEVKNSSFIMRQSLYRDDEMITDMRVTLVTVDVTSLKPVRMPDKIRDEFLRDSPPALS